MFIILVVFTQLLYGVSTVTKIQQLEQVVCPRVATLSSDDKMMAVAGNDSRIEIYLEVSSEFKPHQTIMTNSSQITAIELTKNASKLLAVGDRVFLYLKSAEGTFEENASLVKDTQGKVAQNTTTGTISRDEQYMVIGKDDGHVIIFQKSQSTKYKVSQDLTFNDSSIIQTLLTGNNQFLAVVSTENIVYILKLQNKRFSYVHSLTFDQQTSIRAAWSKNYRHLIISDKLNGKLTIYQQKGDVYVSAIEKEFNLPLNYASLSKDDLWVCVSTDKGTYVYDMDGPTFTNMSQPLSTETGYFHVFSHKSKYLISVEQESVLVYSLCWQDFCVECLDNVECHRCVEGHFLNSENYCSECPRDNCEACLSVCGPSQCTCPLTNCIEYEVNTCTKCEEGFENVNGNCAQVVQEIAAFIVIGILGAIMLALPVIIFCVMKKKKKKKREKIEKLKMINNNPGLPKNSDLFDNIEWPL